REAEAFVENDPFTRAGLQESTQIERVRLFFSTVNDCFRKRHHSRYQETAMNSQLSRRQFLRIAAGAAAFPGAFTYAQATAARIVVGFPPGGTAEALARVLTPLLSPIVGSHVID